MGELLKIDKVSKSYGRFEALREVDLMVPKNSVYGLLGPNGAGKTTLIRIITKMIMPDGGAVWFEDEMLRAAHVRQIGYLPEERGLYKKMKVSEQLLYLARLKGLSKSEAMDAVRYWLDRLGMKSWAQKKVQDLSKGMQQKIQFIATVAHRPSLIILDEPFSGFDPVNAQLIKEEIGALHAEGATILFSTHRMESVEELCDHLALLNQSRLVLDGTKRQIKHDYKTDVFVIEYRGEVMTRTVGFEVLGTQLLEDEVHRSEVRLHEGCGVNDLVRLVTENHRLVSLNEKLPSIHDIFISIVNSGSDA